jgi:hypothetical protein
MTSNIFIPDLYFGDDGHTTEEILKIQTVCIVPDCFSRSSSRPASRITTALCTVYLCYVTCRYFNLLNRKIYDYYWYWSVSECGWG